jgi:hypothetical protein
VLEQAWNLFAGTVRPFLAGPSTSSRDTWLIELGRPFAGILTAAADTATAGVLDDAIKLGRDGTEQTILLVTAALRATESLATNKGHGPGFDELATACAEHLRTALARPRRPSDDWSIPSPAGCSCELCGTLGEFLRNPMTRTLEWPLAQAGRAHVHSRIDAAELPVQHQTRRQGRPYTLVLTKTAALFERERRTRERHQADFAWLTENWAIPG